jgi:hypothetical protein
VQTATGEEFAIRPPENVMTDPHQVNIIIASAIRDCQKDDPHAIGPEAAKLMAKCIIAALEEAGFVMAPSKKN